MRVFRPPEARRPRDIARDRPRCVRPWTAPAAAADAAARGGGRCWCSTRRARRPSTSPRAATRRDPGARRGAPPTELKRAAVEALPVQSVRALLGLDAFGRRIWFYHYLRPSLRPETQRWWDAREAFIREGSGRWARGDGKDVGRPSGRGGGWSRPTAARPCRIPSSNGSSPSAFRAHGADCAARSSPTPKRLASRTASSPSSSVAPSRRTRTSSGCSPARCGELSPHPRWLSPEGHAAPRAHPDRWRVHAGDLATLPADTFSTLVVVGAWTTGDWPPWRTRCGRAPPSSVPRARRPPARRPSPHPDAPCTRPGAAGRDPEAPPRPRAAQARVA